VNRLPRAVALAVCGLKPAPNSSASVGFAPGTSLAISAFSGATPNSASASRYSLNSVVKVTFVNAPFCVSARHSTYSSWNCSRLASICTALAGAVTGNALQRTVAVWACVPGASSSNASRSVYPDCVTLWKR
jgi:hypothetical protein